MMATFQLSRQATLTLRRIQPVATFSRWLNFGLFPPSLIASSLKHPSNYFLSPKIHDCRWICSTPLSLRQEYKAKHSYDSRSASIAINKSTIALGMTKDWRGILELFFKNQDKFNNINYATAMMQLARIQSLDRSDTRLLAFLDSLLENIEQRGLSWIQVRSASNIIYAIGKMELVNPSTEQILDWISKKAIANQFVDDSIRMGNPQGISNTVWAFATLKTKAPHFLAAIEARADWLVENGNAQEVANTAWAFATLKTEAPKLLAAIEAHSDWLVENGIAQNVANTAWTFATLKTQAPNLLAAIEAHSDWLVENGNAQEVANTVWAFATLKTEAPQLLAAIEARSDWLVENGNGQNIANTAWAFAMLKTEAPKLVAAIEARADWIVENGAPQEVANTVWAIAALKMDAPQFLAAIEARSDWLVENGNGQNIANTAWAFATLKTEAPKLVAAIEARADWIVENGNIQNLANTVWAIASLKAEAPKLLAAIEARADWLVENANAQEVTNTAWALASHGIEAPNFFDALNRHQMVVLDQKCNIQNVANLCLAIVIAGRINESKALLQKLWRNAIQLFDPDALFLDEAFRQLAQTQIFASAWGVELAAWPEAMVRRLEEALNAQSAEINVVSRSSKQVSKILKEIGFDHDCEVPPERNVLGGMMAIDFACTKRKVAIEYDGEPHFLKAVGSGELTRKWNGRTKAKRRLLSSLDGPSSTSTFVIIWRPAASRSKKSGYVPS